MFRKMKDGSFLCEYILFWFTSRLLCISTTGNRVGVSFWITSLSQFVSGTSFRSTWSLRTCILGSERYGTMEGHVQDWDEFKTCKNVVWVFPGGYLQQSDEVEQRCKFLFLNWSWLKAASLTSSLTIFRTLRFLRPWSSGCCVWRSTRRALLWSWRSCRRWPPSLRSSTSWLSPTGFDKNTKNIRVDAVPVHWKTILPDSDLHWDDRVQRRDGGAGEAQQGPSVGPNLVRLSNLSTPGSFFDFSVYKTKRIKNPQYLIVSESKSKIK